MRAIMWLMYLTILAYQAVDVWQTDLLLRLGAYEMNPLADVFVLRYGTLNGLLVLKGWWMLALGVCLWVYCRRAQAEER